MPASFGAELLKLRKRPATWVLGLLWLTAAVILGYGLTYVFLSNPSEPAVPQDAPPEAREQARQQQREFQEEQLTFLYPANLASNMLSGFPNLGGPVALILGALAFGSEYGWGTAKTILTQRPARSGVFFGKLLALGVVLVVLVVLAFAGGTVASYVVASLEDAPVAWPPAGELAGAIGAGALILAVWAALGVFLATLLRSTALAIGIGLVYALGLEAIIFSLPIQNETFRDAREYFLGQNSTFLANSYFDADLGGFAPPEPPVEPGRAALVLVAYILAFVLLSALSFRRRDVT